MWIVVEQKAKKAVETSDALRMCWMKARLCRNRTKGARQSG
jgi:hypothetical protein